MSLVSKVIQPVVELLPNRGRQLKRLYKWLGLRKEVVLSQMSRFMGEQNVPDPFKIFWLDPKRIVFHTRKVSSSPDWEDWVFKATDGLKAPVRIGGWHISDLRVSNMRAVRAIEDRIKHGRAWEATDYYKFAVAQIEAGRELWGCRDRRDFDARCKQLDGLIESISKHGYLSADRASQVVAHENQGTALTEVLINLGRNGECLFQDGRHRLAIALALGIESIPVQVLVRHRGWQNFRTFLYRMAHSNRGASRAGSLYQSAMHFDLLDIPAQHSCDDRWNALRPVLSHGGRALDIGCNLGYFCHCLEDVGYSCTGVEYQPEIALAARRIARSEGKSFQVVTGDVLDPEVLDRTGARGADIVIALNIFHHFIKTAEGYRRLQAFLARHEFRCMFFEPHLPDEPQMAGAFANPSPDGFVSLIKEWGRFDSAAPLYTASDGRTIYMLRKT